MHSAHNSDHHRSIRLTFTLVILCLLSIYSTSNTVARPTIDWSESMPEAGSLSDDIERSRSKQPENVETENRSDPTISDFPIEDASAEPPKRPSKRRTSPPVRQHPTKAAESGNTETFKEQWNSTKELPAEANIFNPEDLKARRDELVEKLGQPIWRPIYRQLTHEDFNKYDCCARVLQATSWEVEDKCEEIGLKVWRIEHVEFKPITEPMYQMKECYMLSQESVGNSWLYTCTAKAKAKCYDHNLPQNAAFMEKYNETRRMEFSVEDEDFEYTPIQEENLSLEVLMQEFPDTPKKAPPKDFKPPSVKLDIRR